MSTFDKIGLYTSGDAYNPFNTFSEKKTDYIHHVMYIGQYVKHYIEIMQDMLISFFSENGVYTSHDVYTRIYVTFILGPQEISSLLLFA